MTDLLNLSELTAVSPVDGRYASKTAALRECFSEYALIKNRVTVEVMWFEFLAGEPAITHLPELTAQQSQFLHGILQQFSVAEAQRVKAIEGKINHDVKAVEYYLKEKFAQHKDLQQHSEFLHFCCTSEDINNLSHALMIKQAREQVTDALQQTVIDSLRAKAHELAAAAMMSRTHGQPASPTTMGKEMANVVARLQRQYDMIINTPLLGKINGAVGNYNAHQVTYPDVDWPALAEKFVTRLGLQWNPYTIQIEPHDYMAELFDAINRFNTIVLDTARDIWSYISLGYFKQKPNKDEVGSSTMPHKVNPIDFENAEGNIGIAHALFSHFSEKLPVSRWQRDLTDSTVIRNLGVAFAHSVIAYLSFTRGMAKLEINQSALDNDLTNAWEVLAEPIQMIMRQFRVDQPYEKLKALTRGKSITQAEIAAFVDTLEIPTEAKDKLKALSPSAYIGYANSLAQQI